MLRPEESAALRAASGALLAVGDDGRIAYANTDALRILGWSTNLLGRPLGALVPHRLREQQQRSYGDYTASRRPATSYPKVQPALGEDGVEREVLIAVAGFLRPDGSLFLCSALGPPSGPAPLLHDVRQGLKDQGYEPLKPHGPATA